MAVNRFLTIPQAMDTLDISERRVREGIAQGDLTSGQIDGLEVIPRDSLLELQGRLAEEAFASAEEQERLELERYARGLTLRTLEGMHGQTGPLTGCLGVLITPVFYLIGTLVSWMIDGTAWLVRFIWRGLRNTLLKR